MIIVEASVGKYKGPVGVEGFALTLKVWRLLPPLIEAGIC